VLQFDGEMLAIDLESIEFSRYTYYKVSNTVTQRLAIAMFFPKG